MPFHPQNDAVIGRLINVVPIGGYGWAKIDRDDTYSQICDEPAKFKMRVLEMFYVGSIRTVACGKIEETEHSLNGFWVTLIPCVDNIEANLETMGVSVGTLICPEMPVFDDSKRPINQASVVSTNSTPNYRGISVAGLSWEIVSAKAGLNG